MAPGDSALGMIFVVQTTVGILGNFYLFYHCLFCYLSGYRLRPTDKIAEHLSIANSLFLLFRGVPQTMADFGARHFLGDPGCKLVFYVHRVGRGVSISTTCLLSVFQAIIVSPRSSRWAELKVTAPRYTSFSILLCWVLHILVNILVPVNVTGTMSINTSIQTKDFGYCRVGYHYRMEEPLRAALLSFPDVLCLGIMSWASGSMVLVLHRHKQQVQHIRGNRRSPRSSPESRATRTILLLVSTFVSLQVLSCIFQVCLGVSAHPRSQMIYFSALISAGFPALSPFILMSRDANVCRLHFTWLRNRMDPNVLINM